MNGRDSMSNWVHLQDHEPSDIGPDGQTVRVVAVAMATDAAADERPSPNGEILPSDGDRAGP